MVPIARQLRMSLPAIVVGFALSGWACQTDVGPSAGPQAPSTLLVTNATCQAGRCMTIELRAYVFAFNDLPGQFPWGSRVLAEIGPGQRCVVLPDTLSASIIGPDLSGRIDTTIYRWSDTSAIYLAAVDSVLTYGLATQATVDSANQGIYPYDGLGPSIGETRSFAPASSPGWSVTFPSAPPLAGAIISGQSCKP